MSRSRRRKQLALDLPEKVVHSLIGLLFIALGCLVMFSFLGQGAVLTTAHRLVAEKFGASVLFFPFLCFAAGLMMFRTKRAWAQPSVLLGSVLLMIASWGLLKTGTIGLALFSNLSRLISVPGTLALFASIGIAGILVLIQISGAELIELMYRLAPQPRYKPSLTGEDDQAGGRFVAPTPQSAKASWWPFGKKHVDEPHFTVNNNLLKDAPAGITTGAAPVGAAALAKNTSMPTPPPQSASASTPKSPLHDLDRNLLAPKAPQGAGELLAPPPQPKPAIWEYPPLTLLSDKGGGEANRGDVKSNAAIIERTLNSFGIKARVVEVNYGPAVTQYALEIALGTKLSRITSLATDLALALAAPTGQIRIEAPIAGKSLVGIEVPNHSAQFVTLRTMLQSDTMKKNKSKLAVALGLNVAGQPIIADIAKMPHVLIAGATGSGKSVAINTFICSMLFRASPSEVKFIFVDPKRVELTGYNNIPHLLAPVIVEPAKVVSALKWATHEMDHRYKQLAEAGVKNIDGYNELAGFQALPNIVIIIDELADIMLFAPQEVEDCVTRIAQMARAVGIHLVLATQRPSVDVITGLIKANIPTRIAFNVSSMMDSRVILDSPGAEKLLGRGDMLYVPPDQAKPSRIQGTFVSEKEIKSLVDFVKGQGQQPEYQAEVTDKYQASTVRGGSGGVGGGEDGEGGRDPFFDEAVKLFAQSDKASSSLIQRRLSVGYARAARILDQLYAEGFVGPADGSKPRDVFLTKVREYLVQKQQGG